MAWISFRISTLDPKVALYYRSFDFSDTKRDAGKHVTDVIRDADEVSDSEMRSALETANRLRATGYKEMSLLVAASIRSGMTKLEVYRTLKHSGLSKIDIRAVMTGKAIPWRYSNTTAKNQAKKAHSIFGKEGYKRVIGRYQRLRVLAKESGKSNGS